MALWNFRGDLPEFGPRYNIAPSQDYVNPLVAILLGYSLGKEIITPRILLAAGLIIGSVVLVSAPR
jgi:drug/metabolite transporter (DMT)-like permease